MLKRIMAAVMAVVLMCGSVDTSLLVYATNVEDGVEEETGDVSTGEEDEEEESLETEPSTDAEQADEEQGSAALDEEVEEEEDDVSPDEDNQLDDTETEETEVEETEETAEEMIPSLAAFTGASGSYENVTWSIDSAGTLVVEGTGEFSSGTDFDRAPWYDYRTQIKTAEINLSEVSDLSYMFYGCSLMTSVDVSGFNTSNTTNMSYMFYDCRRLTSIDAGGLDTGNVTNVAYMFGSCAYLEDIDLSGFNTSSVTNMRGMFSGCSSLSDIDLDSFDTGNVTDMGYMFSSCSFTSLDLTGFDTGAVQDMSGMFSGCSSLTSIDISGFDTKSVTSMAYMFNNCSSLTSVDVTGFDTSNVTDMSSMFNYCSSLRSLDVRGFDTSNVTNMNSMFLYCRLLTSSTTDVSNFDTGNVTDMSYMFYRCTNLGSIDVSGFDTSNVTNMASMFYYCSISKIDVSNFDTSNVTNMACMFYECGSLKSIDVSGFNTSNVTTMSCMFYNCSGLTSLDVSGFDTGNVTIMDRMFYYCSGLTSLDVSGFDTSKVTTMNNMFSYCTKLTGLDVSGFDTENVTNMNYMFYNCSNITSLDLSSLNLNNATATDLNYFIYKCSALSEIKTPVNLTRSVTLPTAKSSDVWYMYDGSAITTLPQNLGYSVLIMKNEVPETPVILSEITVPENLCGILVMSADSKAAVEGATVEVGSSTLTTDEGGMAYTANTGKQRIIVSADGYSTVSCEKTLEKGQFVTISLVPDSDELNILVAEADLDGDSVDLLNAQLYLFKSDLDEMEGEEKELTITVRASGDATCYQLLQHDKIVQENVSSVGLFKITVKEDEESGYLYTEDLDARYKLYVRVYDSDGNYVQKCLGVKLATTSELEASLGAKDKKWTLNLEKISVTVPDSVPLFGGGEIKTGFESALPVKITVDESGKVKVAVNAGDFDTSDSDAWKEVKEEYKELKDLAINRAKYGKEFNGTPESFGAGLFSVKGSITGYGEGYIGVTGEVCINVGLIVKVEGEDKFTNYYFISFIPFYVTYGGGVELKASGSVSLAVDADGLSINGGTLEFEVKPYLKLEGGVGADGLLSIGAYGKATLETLIRFSDSYKNVTLNGNVKIKATALCWSKVLAELDGDYVVYDSNKKKSYALSRSLLSASYYDMSGAELISMDYLAEREAAQSRSTYSLLRSAAVSTEVLSYAYENASPTLLQVGDDLYLFYLDGVADREAQNQTALFYMKSSDGGSSWNDAVRVDNLANETADYEYDVATDGEKIYALWSEENTEYGDEILTMDSQESIEQMAADMDLMMAVIDCTDESIETLSLGTELADMKPQLAVGDDGTVYAAWITNDLSSEDGMFSSDNGFALNYASSADDFETVASCALSIGYYPLTVDIGIMGTDVYAALDVDVDADLDTQEDREIYLLDLQNGGNFTAFTENEVTDSVPVFSSVGGSSCLLWYQDGNIAYTLDGETVSYVFDSENLPTMGQEFSVLSGTDGKAAIVWTSTSLEDDGGVELYCTDFDGTEWSSAYFLQELESEYTTVLSGYLDGSDYVAAYLGTVYSDEDTVSTIRMLNVEERTDTEVSYTTDAEEAAGSTYPVTFVVTNTGNLAVSQIQVTSSDGTITDTLEADIAPGETAEILYEGITLPTDFTEPYSCELTLAADGETDTSNNEISLYLGAPELAVEAALDFSGGRDLASVSMTNNGLVETDIQLEVFTDEDHETMVYSEVFASVAPEEIRTTVLDLAVLDETAETFYFVVSDVNDLETADANNESLLYLGKGMGNEYTDEESPKRRVLP